MEGKEHIPQLLHSSIDILQRHSPQPHKPPPVPPIPTRTRYILVQSPGHDFRPLDGRVVAEQNRHRAEHLHVHPRRVHLLDADRGVVAVRLDAAEEVGAEVEVYVLGVGDGVEGGVVLVLGGWGCWEVGQGGRHDVRVHVYSE